MDRSIDLRFNEIIRFVASKMRFFSADELNLLAYYAGFKPHHNEVSSAFLKARAEGLIERTDRARKSTLYGKNAVARTIWRSLKTKEAK
jgi:hypothetical protein